MKTRFLAFTIMFMIITLPFIGQAQIPRTLSYQGVLSDETGSPKPDGSYIFTFSLYDASAGGAAIWAETKTLDVIRGLFHTVLGVKEPFGVSLEFDEPYWLGILVEGEPELSPRIPLTSVGYSFNSLRADTASFALSTAGGAGDGHSLDADDGDPTDAVYVDGDGNVGIGTMNPGAMLDVAGQMKITGKVSIRDSAATDHWGKTAPFFIDYTDTDYGKRNYLKIWGSPNTNEMRISNQPRGIVGGYLTLNQNADLKVHGQQLWTSKLRSHYHTSLVLQATTNDLSEGIDFVDNNGTLLMHVDINGNVGIGTTSPGEKLTVTGIVESTTGGFKFPDGTIQTSAGIGTDNDWTVSGNDMYSAVSGNIGIGTASPVSQLDINAGSESATLTIQSSTSSSPSVVHAKTGIYHANFGVENGVAVIRGIGPTPVVLNSGANQVMEFQSDGVTNMRITSNGNVGIGTMSPETKLQVSSGDVYIDNIGSGIILRSPDGSCFRVTVNNDGTFASASITCP